MNCASTATATTFIAATSTKPCMNGAVGPHDPQALDDIVLDRPIAGTHRMRTPPIVARPDARPRSQRRRRRTTARRHRTPKPAPPSDISIPPDSGPPVLPADSDDAEPAVGGQQVRTRSPPGERGSGGRVVQHSERAHDERGHVEGMRTGYVSDCRAMQQRWRALHLVRRSVETRIGRCRRRSA